MRLATVKRGDRIEFVVRGWRSTARVVNPRCGEIPGKPVRIEPDVACCSFYHLAAHQVKRILAPEQEAML